MMSPERYFKLAESWDEAQRPNPSSPRVKPCPHSYSRRVLQGGCVLIQLAPPSFFPEGG